MTRLFGNKELIAGPQRDKSYAQGLYRLGLDIDKIKKLKPFERVQLYYQTIGELSKTSPDKLTATQLSELAKGLGEIKKRMLKACFAAGTLLYTPQGYRAIEAFRVGDEVLSRAEEDPTFEISVKRVEEVFVHTGRIWILKVNGRVIHTTGEHPFWVCDRGWVNACELAEGNRLLSHDGQWVVVEAIEDTNKYETVYNLRISDYHTYFVGDWDWGFSVWAHNACVVKGGTGTAWRIDTFDENGVSITGSSASSEPGKTVAELSVGIPNGQVRVTTTEAIAAAGGAVIPTRRTPANPYHVTITGLTVAQLNTVFGPPIPNPARP